MKKPSTPDIVANARVGPALAVLGRYVTATYRTALAPTGLAARHVAALRRLGSGDATQLELRAELGVDAAKLVRILNELENESLVARRRDPSDRRRHNVAITELGRARLAGVEQALAFVENVLLADLDVVQRSYLAVALDAMAVRVGLERGSSLPDDDPP